MTNSHISIPMKYLLYFVPLPLLYILLFVYMLKNGIIEFVSPPKEPSETIKNVEETVKSGEEMVKSQPQVKYPEITWKQIGTGLIGIACVCVAYNVITTSGFYFGGLFQSGFDNQAALNDNLATVVDTVIKHNIETSVAIVEQVALAMIEKKPLKIPPIGDFNIFDTNF